MSIINEFWIITDHGIPLFNYSPNKDLDPNLISGFFSAIQKYSSQIKDLNEGYINSFSFGDSVFNFLINPKYKLFFISKSSNKIKSKLINKHLKEIQKMFIGRFEEKINNFDGEVSIFQNFKQKFETYFNNNFTQLKGIW
jgi:hypothetical protein